MKHLCITTSHDHPTLAYAARECRLFLEKTTALEVTAQQGTANPHADADYLIRLTVDSQLAETQYAVGVDHATATTITLRGHDEACVLHALYDMLEKAGVYFDVLGPILPDSIELGELPSGEQVVTPFVKRRGIRQHINFTMDVSSYPLPEALEYIRNLARLRMNHITFHSYNGQWFGYTKDGVFQHGGNFFYGTRHVLPQREPFLGSIRNREVYCIPEIEPVIDNPEERSRAATEWLNAVMAECKRVGMHVELSIEPPGGTHDERLAVCREVMKLYPLIDTLELITPECGDSIRTLDRGELKAYVAELFGPEALDQSLLDVLGPDLEQLEGGLRHVAQNIRLAKELAAASSAARAEAGLRAPQFAVGAYITCPDTLRILHLLMDRFTPPDVSLSFLPAHGARRAVVNLQQMGFTPERIRRSMLYSWVEFDGNMYLQQNSVTGTKQLLSFARTAGGGEQVAAVALNHWRTAENRTCIAYAGQAFIRGPVDPHDFYQEYAQAFGIDDAESFTAIMQEIDDLDDLAREKMFNIGFCAGGCWVRPGLRWTRQWENPAIDECRNRLGEVTKELARCLASATAPRGRELLRFLINRVRCSIYQLDCAQAMKSLAGFCDHDRPNALTKEQKRTVVATCNSAMESAQRYLNTHAEAILDRGCEGTLISYETTMPNYIDHIRAVFVEGEKECTHILPQFDEPPPPLVN